MVIGSGEVASVFAKITLDSSQFSSELSKAEGKLKSFSSNLESLSGKASAALKGALVSGVGAATAAAGVGLKSFIEYESGLADVAKTTGMAGEELDNLGNSLRELSKQTGTGVTELTKMAAIAGQMGIQGVDNITKFTETVNQASTAFGMTAEESATALAKLGNIWDVPAKELYKFGSAVNYLGNTSAASERELFNFMMNIGNQPRVIGMTAQETLALGDILVSMGMDASDAGTRLNSAFGAQGLLGHLPAAAKQLGVTEEALRKMIDADPTETILKVVESLGKISSESERVAAAQEIFGAIGAKAILPLIGRTDEFRNKIEEVNNAYAEGTSMANEFAARQNTLANQLNRVKAGLNDVAISIGQALAPSVRKFADWMNNDAVPALKKFVDALAKGDIKSAFEVIASTAKSALQKVIEVVTGIGTKIKDSLQKIDWGAMFSKIGDALDTVWGSLKNLGSKIYETVANIDWGNVFSKVVGAAEAVWGAFKEAGTKVYETVSNIDWGGLGRTAADKLKTAFEVLKDVGDRLKNSISNVDWAGIGGAAAEKVRAGFDALRDIGNKIKTYVDSVNWSDVGNKAATSIRQGMDTLKDLGDRVKNFIESVNWNSVGGSLGQKLREGFEKLATLHETLQNSLKRWADDPGGAYATGQAIGRALRDAALAAWDAVKWAADLMRQIVSGIESKKAEYGGSIVRAIIGEARAWLDAAATAGKNLLSGILSELSPLGAMLRNAIIDAVSGAVEGLPVVGSDFARKLREWKVEVPTVQRPSGAGMPTTTESGASGSTYTPSTWTSTSTPAAAFTSLRQPKTHTYGELTAAAGTVATTGYYTIEFLYKGKVYKSTADVIKAMASEGKTEAEIAESLYYATEPLKSEEYTSYVLIKEDTRDLQKVLTTIYKTVPTSLFSSERELEKARALGAYQLGVQEYEKQKAAANAALEASEKVEDVSSDVEKAAEKSEEAAKQTTEANKSSQTAAIDVNKLIEAFRLKTYSAGESVTGAAQYAATSLKLGAEVAKKFTTDAGQAVVISFDAATNAFKANIGSAGTALKQTGDYNLMKAQEMGAVITNSGTSTSSNIGLGGLRAQTSMQTGGQVAQTHIQAGGQAAQSALVTGANTIYSRIASIPDIGVKIATAADYFASKVVSAAISAASAISRAVSGRSIGGALGTPIRYAEGGVVTRPVLGMVGEAGAEAIVPLRNKSAGWAVLQKILPQFGIKPFAEGGIVGDSEPTGGENGIVAYLGLKGLDAMSKSVRQTLINIQTYFRQTWAIIKATTEAELLKIRMVLSAGLSELVAQVVVSLNQLRTSWAQTFADTAKSSIDTFDSMHAYFVTKIVLLNTFLVDSVRMVYGQINTFTENFKGMFEPITASWETMMQSIVSTTNNAVNAATSMLNTLINTLNRLTGGSYNINVNVGGGGGGGGYSGGGGGGGGLAGYSSLFADAAINSFFGPGSTCEIDELSGMSPGLIQSLYQSGAWKPNEYALSQQIYEAITKQTSNKISSSVATGLSSVTNSLIKNAAAAVASQTGVKTGGSTSYATKLVSSAAGSARALAGSPSWMTSSVRTSGGVVKIGKYQHGGIAATPQLALIAERGPEVVLPAKILDSLGAPNVNVVIELDGRKITDVVMKRAVTRLQTKGMRTV
ncbi:phage tail tape measure protein [Candidatus Bathyarchaeota archaeon A05DMB-2]|jgi:TP901 family phage tail tape measure protein|nr:phage tail tape measure protein [Candidatus Bathyarchaeota archaeon A05DMB-2]